MRERDAFGVSDTRNTVSPFANVQSISSVYFPQFSGLIGGLERASDQYKIWIFKTLKDAANYIQKLPKAEQDLDEWQAAVEALLLVVELEGPTMMACIGVMRALNRHVERVFNPSRKDTQWGTRKLKRGQ